MLIPAKKVGVDVQYKNTMSVNTAVFKWVEEEVYQNENQFICGLEPASAELDEALEIMQSALSAMIELAETEKNCKLLANGIERTRRRVNVLAYVMIPQLEETAKYISMKLDESERSSRVRFMKIKEMVRADETN